MMLPTSGDEVFAARLEGNECLKVFDETQREALLQILLVVPPKR